MKKKDLPLVIIIASLGLIIWNLIETDFTNIGKGFWLRIISSILIIIAMILTIRERKKGNLE
jgi:uncharacterized protein (DUF983 family)